MGRRCTLALAPHPQPQTDQTEDQRRRGHRGGIDRGKDSYCTRVEFQGDRSIEVQQEIAQRSSAVVKLLQKNTAVTKLDTTGVTLSPTYSYKDNQQTLSGYHGTNIVRFQIDPTAIGTLLDDVVKSGATRIDGVTLVASDEAIAAAEDKAIAQATQQAQRQAAAALGPLKLKQQDVLRIQINQAPSPEVGMFNQMKLLPTAGMPVSSASAAPVVAGEQRVQATVTLQLRY